MQVPYCYFEELDQIIEEIKSYNAPELYLAYKQLGWIRKIFTLYSLPEDHSQMIRLLKAREYVDREIEKALIDYEGLKIEKEVRNETKA